MNSASHEYLKKTVFWQRFAAAVLSIFMIIMWGTTIYFYVQIQDPGTDGNIIFSIFWGYLMAGSYVNYILFQAQFSLNNYLKSSDMMELELAFRKQRHFWMGLSLMVLSVFVVFLFLGIYFSFVNFR